MIKQVFKSICFAIVIIGMVPLSHYSLRAQSTSHMSTDVKQKTKRFKRAFFMAENDLFDGRVVLKYKDKLSLTKEQEKKIQEKMLDHESFSIRNSAEIKIKELRFASYLKSNTIDREKVARFIRDISSAKTDLIVDYLNYVLDVKAILTPKQLEILKESREKLKKRFKRMRQNRKENQTPV